MKNKAVGTLNLVILISFMLTITGSGCDQIKGLIQYFSKKNVEDTNVQPASEVEAQAQPATEAAPEASSTLPADVLAQIGSWSITKEEFDERLKGLEELGKDPRSGLGNLDVTNIETKKIILEEIIRQQLLINDAEKSGVAQRKDVLDAVEEFRRSVLVREMALKAVEGIKISDEEAQKYYDENKSAIIKPLELRVREIVVDDQLKANEISVEALKGSDFAELAKQNSKGKTAASGGDLGFISQAPFPEMGQILLALKPGEVSTVFKGPDGFYIVKLEEKKGGESIPLEEVKQEIVAGLTQMKQQQVITEYIDKLKADSKIEVNEELLAK